MDFIENEIVFSEMLTEAGIIHGFSTKLQGNMSYDRDHQHQAEQNIQNFLSVLGLNLSDNCLVKLPVKNSPNIAVLNKPEVKGRLVLKEDDPAITKIHKDDRYGGFDAGISKAKETLLGILPADCAPVMLYDPQQKYYAIIHAGRAGVENGIVFKTIFVLTTLGIKPANLLCYVGPHICHSCYKPDGKNYNLIRNISQQLKILGIQKIETTRYCTYHDRSTFFSNHRAKGNQDEGRHLAIIGKK